MTGADPQTSCLTSRLARGEPAAFAEAYDVYGPRLHAYLLGLTGDRGLAEDLLQTVMLRLVRHRDRLQGVESLKAWLYVVARNEARRHGRRVSTRPMAALDAGVFEIAASTEATRDPEPEALHRALPTLSRERFEVVTLKIHHDLTFVEIGEILDISPNTAASRYRRALTDLRTKLEAVHVER